MSSSETRRLAEYPLFDWLRFAMATLVMAAHFSFIPWSQAGNLGVQVFFSLSGWLIGSILIEMGRDKIPLFYFNRATRVWIPYFAAMVLLYGLSAVRDPVNLRWLEFLFYDVTFTHNFFSLLPEARQAIAEMPLKGTGNHFWSLAVEEQFYLFAPLLIFFSPAGRHPLTWVAIAVVAILVRQEFSAIAFGVAAAALHHRAPGYQTRTDVQAALVVLALGSAFCMTLPGGYLYAVPFFAISTVMLLARTGERGRIGRFLGGMSYPLYLNHWIALIAASVADKRLGGGSWLWGSIGMVTGFAIGAAAYLLVDKPVLARRMRWYSPSRGRFLAGLAYVLVGVGVVGGLYLRVI